MSAENIPEGVMQVSELMKVDPTEIWQGLEHVLNNDEKITLFNQTIKKSIKQGKAAGKPDKDIAMQAMNVAGEAILGPDRPVAPSPIEMALAGNPLIKVTRREKASTSSSRTGSALSGIPFLRIR